MPTAPVGLRPAPDSVPPAPVSVMVRLSCTPVSGSMTLIPENGVTGVVPVVVWPALAPLITGGSLTAVAVTVLASNAACPAVSLIAAVTVV